MKVKQLIELLQNISSRDIKNQDLEVYINCTTNDHDTNYLPIGMVCWHVPERKDDYVSIDPRIEEEE